uniref:Integrase catalytic domain-containing protein n=1 Tax=Trichuris muris TaxID=70415 RepID=A0A5S6QXK4_TRIMR
MGDLPSCRVDLTLPAFTNTGVDLFGPIEVNVLRSKVKRYGCLFTCMSSRACHLEVAYSLDVNSFINCLRRFIARRGCPLRIFSDNGKNLVAAERLLRQIVVPDERVDRFLTGQNIDWKFTPPYCPHYGGSWERLIGVTKRALVATLQGNAGSDEVLATVLAEVEALLNGRPLTYLSSDPECFEPFTPFHILIGRQNSNVPAVVAAGPATPRRHWKAAQAIADRFWTKWLKEYLPTLQRRQKWTRDRPNSQVGDYVTIIDPSLKRGSWPTGRITQDHPGKDDVVRTVTVRTASRTYVRPAARIALLETSQGPEEVCGDATRAECHE